MRVREKDPKNFLSEPDSLKTFWQLGCQVATLFAPLGGGLKYQTFHTAPPPLPKKSKMAASGRGAKSAATWQPSCQKVFEESGSDRKFLDLSPILSCNLTIWW